jgi:CheY-like chemotaxis protein
MARVLIVDDNQQIVRVTSLLLSHIGHITEGLTSSWRFRETFAAFKPDAIILDMVMPNVDGLAILRWLQDEGYTGHVVLMSGDQSNLDIAGRIAISEKCMTVTALHKPFQLMDLERVLRPLGQSRANSR